MSDNLLQKLEEKLQKLDEKMMMLLAEIEESHHKIQELVLANKQLNDENASMKIQRELHAERLAGLISTLDQITETDKMIANSPVIPAMKPVLIQG
jgi:regulator of replication initiation timing